MAPTARADGNGNSNVAAEVDTTDTTLYKATYNGSEPAPGDGSIKITNPQKGETYSIYKVFDATASGENDSNVSYTGTVPEQLTNYFEASNGNVIAKDAAKDSSNNSEASSELIEALDNWAKNQTAMASVVYPSNTATAALEFASLPYGYYYITTTSGTAVTITTAKTVEVTDKNEAPQATKRITGVSDSKGSVTTTGDKAIAEVGSTVNYEATITKRKGAKNYVYHDQMDSTKLKFIGSVTVKAGETTLTSGTDYNLVASRDELGEDTFQIKFTEAGIAKVADNSTITIAYSATVLSNALQTDPAKNKAWLTYGDNGKTSEQETEVYNAKVTAKKYAGEGTDTPLQGAKFVLAKTTDGSTAKYYKYTPAEGDSSAKIEWVSDQSKATIFTSDASGDVKSTTPQLDGFMGLADGSYSLIETEAPAGYIKGQNHAFTINDANKDDAFSTTGTQSNLIKSGEVHNTPGSELPSTGGPGTTALYVVGAILVLAAGIGLVARRRMRQH